MRVHGAVWLMMLVFALPVAAGESAGRPVHTYSIVARDPGTGQLGVAVQSHWFSVGSTVTWAEAGVGAIATQSFVDPAYGHRGLELLRSGLSAEQTLQALVSVDEGREVRQVAIVDSRGRVAAHTGARCIELTRRLQKPGIIPAGEEGQALLKRILMEGIR